MRRDKTGKWHSVLSLAVVALTLALGSCTKEQTEPSLSGGDGVEVRVSFPQSGVAPATTKGTEEGTTDENRIDMVTILVFNENGTTLETVLSVDVTSANTSLPTTHPKWASDKTLILSPVIDPEKPKKVYAIANWSKTEFDKATYTEAMLKDEITTIASVTEINGNAAYPMLMSGSVEAEKLITHSLVKIDMTRQSSKLSAQITIPMAVQDYMPHIEWLTDHMTITVANVPNKSFIVGRGSSPADIIMLDYIAVAVNDIKPAAGDQTHPATKDLTWQERIYVTENPIMGTSQTDKDASTYIIVQLPYKNSITGNVSYNNYYQLPVNDKQDAVSPHKVLRNTIYNFNISIKGMGLPLNDLIHNIEGELTVTDWEQGEIVDVEDTPQYYFNVDRTHLVFQSTETSVQSTIATNVTDWKLVKRDGTTVVSFTESKTTAVIDDVTYTLTSSASAATITVSTPTASTNFGFHKMFLLAKNLKVPFTVVADDNGFIPNEVLSRNFMLNGGTFPGWPKEELPPNGLQIAMRGNKVLPGGVAEADDPLMQWKTTNTSTTGTTVELGMGISNTDKMAGAEHPAAQYCRDMGEGWFLPSVDELKLIYTLVSMLGNSYTFTPDFYWTSVENKNISSNSLHVDFRDGDTYTTSYNKTIARRVRCVRYI